MEPKAQLLENVPYSLDAFQCRVPARKTSLAYRAALALCAFAIVLLPLLYIAIIVATGYGVYLYVIHGTGLFSNDVPSWISLLIYAGPIVAGVTLIAFMVKPLFSRAARPADLLPLDLAAEPQLRNFITALCDCVGAPMPIRIEIDCQVNASARLRRGFRSLGQRDLVLTIGLPLAGGLTTQQFAGVLAHEFGHFAQDAGMGFIFVIRSVNTWFSRVVFGRDHWDVTLKRLSEKGDFRIAGVMLVTRGFVWMTRKILHGLMYVCQAITCLQLRNMEYDADYYAVQIAGGVAFRETSIEIRRLNAASQIAMTRLKELWQNQRLVDDFPAFVTLQRTRFKQETLTKLDAASATVKNRWLDTHPSDAQRCAHAEALHSAGIYHNTEPATVLFSDFPVLSRLVTRHYYRKQLHLNFHDGLFVSGENAASTAVEITKRMAAYKHLTGDALDLTRPLLWTTDEFASTEPEGGPLGMAKQLADYRLTIAKLRAAAIQNEKTYGSIQNDGILLEITHAFLSAKVYPQREKFRLICTNLAEAEEKRIGLNARRTAIVNGFQPFESAVHSWISAVAQAVRDPVFASCLSADKTTYLVKLTDALAQFTPWFRAMPDWFLQHHTLSVLAANERQFAKERGFATLINSLRERIDAIVQSAPSLVGATPYPFPCPDGDLSAAELQKRSLEGVDRDTKLGILLNYVGSLYFRLIGEIALLGEELEHAMIATPTENNARPVAG